MGVIDEFVSEYERQFDFWEAAARTARGLLEAELASSGLRALVTSRAKSLDRLEEKLRGRDRKNPYESVEQIGQDVADLAGVRVALYFPGQIEETEQVIRTTFDVQKDKRFPSGDPDDASSGSAHRQRFSGYGARHFRVHIPTSRLSGGQERYATALIEVQVASVLMHAWSEVEHDLVYKPLDGALSASEYALLDQLNGLMLAGEIALEQLQQAGDARVAAAETPFRNHYELAEFLRTRLSALGTDLTEATLGRIDVLFDFLAGQDSATASSVARYLDQIEQDFEHRPLADQLADLMLSGDQSLYETYRGAMASSRHQSKRRHSTRGRNMTDDPLEGSALGEFIATWVILENILRSMAESDEDFKRPLPTLFRHLVERNKITPEQYLELSAMRKLRNIAVHGRGGEVPPEQLRESTEALRHLIKGIEHNRDEMRNR